MSNDKIEIIDDVVDDSFLDEMLDIIMSNDIEYYFQYCEKHGNFPYWVHPIITKNGLMSNPNLTSPIFEYAIELFENYFSDHTHIEHVIRSYIVVTTREKKFNRMGMHVDVGSTIPAPQLKIGVFHLNSCNGYTIFENSDGSERKIKNVRNRLILAPSTIRHCLTNVVGNIPRRLTLSFVYC